MKNKLLVRLLMVAMAAGGAASAHASTQTLDFTGFTVSFDNSLLTLASSSQYSFKNLDFRYDYNPATSWTYSTPGSGVKGNTGYLSFNDPSLSAEASGNNGSGSQSASFSFNVLAKPGWGLGTAYTGLSGDWTQNHGGISTVSASNPNSEPGNPYSYTYSTINGKNFQSGNWAASSVVGSSYGSTSTYTTLYDNANNWAGYKYTYTTNPLNPSSLTSTMNMDLKATTSAPNQYALAETNGPLYFQASAFAPITAPVPEPETYAMMLAGLGLIGVRGRRRQKN